MLQCYSAHKGARWLNTVSVVNLALLVAMLSSDNPPLPPIWPESQFLQSSDHQLIPRISWSAAGCCDQEGRCDHNGQLCAFNPPGYSSGGWRPVGGAVHCPVLYCAPQSTGVTFFHPLLQLKVCDCVVHPYVMKGNTIVFAKGFHRLQNIITTQTWTLKSGWGRFNESWKYCQNSHLWYPLQSLVSSTIKLVVVALRERLTHLCLIVHIPLVLLSTPDLTQI